MKMTGMKIAAIAMVVAIAAKVISLDPSSAACRSILSHLVVSNDVLEHHDRVVDDDPDCQAESEQL